MGRAEAPITPARPTRRIIERPRLLKLLEETDAQTILLVAPAGYGKTTLARQWADLVDGAWLPLRPASADYAVMARDLVAAIAPGNQVLMRLAEQVVAAGGSERRAGQLLAQALARETSETSHRSQWLVVDDYHAVSANAAAENVLRTLHSRGAIRMLIASRIRPRWVRSRELLYGEVLELSVDDLALGLEETAELLPGKQPAVRLHELSRGWPAAIGLAAHLVSRGEQINVHNLTDSMYDYLAEEVYSHLTPQVCMHLMQLAVHPSLSRADAETVVGGVGALADVLATGLAHEASAVVEIHPLSRSFLLGKLRGREDQEEVTNTGVDYALRTGAWDDAFALITEFQMTSRVEGLITAAYEPLVETGRFATLERYAAWAAEKGAASLILLDLIDAEIARNNGDVEQAANLGVSSAEALPESHPLKGRGYFVAGSAMHISWRLEEALAFHTKALAYAKTPSERVSAAWSRFLSALYLEIGDAKAIFDEFRSAATSGNASRLRIIIGRLHLARLEGVLYDLRADAESASKLLDSIVDPWVRTGWGNTYGYTLLLQARYQTAHEALTKALAEITEFDLGFGRPHIEWSLAAVELGLRRFAAADKRLRSVERCASDMHSAHLTMNAMALRARLLIAEHRAPEAAEFVARDFPVYPSRSMYGEYLGTRALVLAVLGKTRESRRSAAEAETLTDAIEAKILSAAAVAVCSLGTRQYAAAADALMEECIARDSWDGLVIAVRGAPELLKRMASSERGRDYLTSVLRRSNDLALARSVGLALQPAYVRSSPLTPREQEVIDLLALGLRNSEIAQALFISDATVKVHIRHILEKLGARTRAEAVLRYAEITSGRDDDAAARGSSTTS